MSPLAEAVCEGHLNACELLLAKGGRLLMTNQSQVQSIFKLVQNCKASNDHQFNVQQFQFALSPIGSTLPKIKNCTFYERKNATKKTYFDGEDNEQDPLLVRLALLLHCKGDANIHDENQRRPLHLAAADGKLSAAYILLSFGASPNLQDRWRATPLSEAFRGAHDDLCQILISGKADVDHIQQAHLRAFVWDAIRLVCEMLAHVSAFCSGSYLCNIFRNRN